MATASEHRLSAPLPTAAALGAASRALGNGVRPAEVRNASDPKILLPQQTWYLLAKDWFDRMLAFLLLLITAPLILLAMILVKATSRGPALYSQARVGRHGKIFTLFKIRSMVVESESLTGACWSSPGDRRITRVGRWLRRTHIDELPQLWNVLLGDMSLVGPRPERPEFVPTLEQAIPYYRDRLLVRPGITGFAQVQRPPDTGLESVRSKLAYDLHYVQSVGFWFDLRICCATALKMLGAGYRFIASVFRFPGPDIIEGRYRCLAEEVARKKQA